MTRLPTAGADNNAWGTILNAFLAIAHNADGSLKNLVCITDPAYGAVADNGATDNSTAIQSAINAVSAAGGGIVFIPAGSYGVASSIAPKSNVTLLGCGVSSVIFRTTTGNTIDGRSTVVTDFVVDGICFTGPVNQTVSTPTRARTTSGNGTQTAIYISGDLDSGLPGNSSFTNFTMRNCIVKNNSALPIRIGGVRGKVIVIGCEFYNNQDVGFVYNQEVIFNDNHVLMSADNGVSISRGNIKITCNGNTFENCCYNGIWIAGFSTTLGPTNFSCVGNTIKSIGNNGIYCDSAPEYGVISSNSIDCGYNRGPSDGASDTYGFGIYVGGYPTSPRSSPTNYALGIVISSNFVRTAPRGGIYLSGVQNFMISNNLLLDIGTQYLADGVTSIASNNATNNIGIYFEQSSTVTNGMIVSNHIIDSRGTAYCNYGIVPQTPDASVQYMDNQMRGCRNAFNLQECDDSTTRVYNYAMLLNANMKATAGATAGGNSASGTVAGFDLNGAAASTRKHQILTAGVARWLFGGNSDAESGSNAGTNFVIAAYDDSGNLLNTPITITRSSGAIALAAALTPNGGMAPINAGFTSFGTGGVTNLLNTTSGTNVTMVAGTIYWAAVFIPMNVTLTGIIFTIGTTGGTDKWIGALYNSAGTLVANSTTAGTTVGTASTKQKLAFTGTYNALGPSVYYIALQSNGTTAKMLALGNVTEGFVTGSVAGTFGTLPSITPGSTYTSAIGPFASTY